MNNFRRRVGGGDNGPTSLGTYQVIKSVELMSFNPYYMCDTSSPRNNTEQLPLTGTFSFSQISDCHYLQCKLKYYMTYDKIEAFDDDTYEVIQSSSKECTETSLIVFDSLYNDAICSFTHGINNTVQWYSDRNASVYFETDNSREMLDVNAEIGTSVTYDYYVICKNDFAEAPYTDQLQTDPFVRLTITKIGDDLYQYSVTSLI